MKKKLTKIITNFKIQLKKRCLDTFLVKTGLKIPKITLNEHIL